MARFGYLKGNSFFHKMDPSWKLLWSFVAIVTVILNFDIPYNIAWLIYALFLILLVARIPFSVYLRAISFFLLIALFMATWDAIYYAEEANVLLAWGPITVTEEGILEGIGVFLDVFG